MADRAQIGPQAGVQIGADGKVRRQPSRGMYILPSLFTAGNMAAGYYAITQSIQGSVADQSYFDRAALALAYIWGFRMLPELEHPQLREQLVHIGIFVCFIFLVCGASRLARFNISTNPQPRNPGRPGKKYFVGMPIPAGAGVISSVIHFQRGSPIDNPWIAVVWLGLLLFTSFLMVSNWRFWSAKELTAGGRHPFQLVAWIVTDGCGCVDCGDV